MSRTAPPSLLAALLVAGAALLPGCVARQPGAAASLAAGRAEPAPRLGADAWPRRHPAAEIHDERSTVALLAAPRGGPPEERMPIGEYGLGSLWRIDVEELVEPDELERLRRERGFREWIVFQTYLDWSEVDMPLRPLAEPRGEPRMERVRLVEISETSFALYLPEGQPRGLVVQMTNLAGNTDWERQVTAAFRSRGWAVLSTFVPDGWALAEAVELDLRDGPEAVGRRIARAVDDRLAEWAYGVEAALEYIGTRYPEIPPHPVVGLGSSAGAISLPAVSARLRHPFDATVLIGGGVDSLSVLRYTSLGITPVRFRWVEGRRPDGPQWEAIQASFEASTRLDGIHTASFLRDRPVLLLHAAWDRIVDARTGERLWEILDRPERWTYQAGHLGLFFFWLPLEKNRLVDWVEAAID